MHRRPHVQLVWVEGQLPVFVLLEVVGAADVDPGVVGDALDVAGGDGGDDLDQVLRCLTREPALGVAGWGYKVGVGVGVRVQVRVGVRAMLVLALGLGLGLGLASFGPLLPIHAVL